MRLPLAVNMTTRDGTLTRDGHIANGYIEQIVKGKTYMLARRPGLTTSLTVGSGQGHGISSFVNPITGVETLYAINANAIWLANASTVTNTTWTKITQDLSDGGSGDFMFSFGGYLWYVLPSGSIYYKRNASDATWTQAVTGNAFVARYTAIYVRGNVPVLNDVAYIIAPSGLAVQTKDVWSSTNGTTWSLLTTAAAFQSMNQARTLTFAGKLWNLGGALSSGWTNDVYNSTDGITWTLVTATPAYMVSGVARQRFGVCVFAGKMWVIGGWTSGSGYLNDVYYSTDGITWTQATTAGAFTAVLNPVVGSIGPTMYLFGGSNAQQTGQGYKTVDGVTWTSLGAMDATFTANVGQALWMDGIIHQNKFVYPVGFAGTTPNNVNYMYQATTTTASTSLSAFTVGANEIANFAQTYDTGTMMVKSTLEAYTVDTTSQVATKITSANYPGLTVPGLVELLGTFYVMDAYGTIYGSDANMDDPTTWAALDTIDAEFENDGGVALAKYNQYVVAFGKWTIEYFWDAGNATGSVLAAVSSAPILVGCASAGSVCSAEGTVVFMGQKKGQTAYQTGRFIGVLDGMSYREISTEDVSRILDKDDLAVVYSATLGVAGHTFYCLTLKTSAITLVYDFKTQLWYTWTTRTAGASKSVTTLTSSGTTATAVCTGHGNSDGDPVTIAGANEAGYNGTYNITYVDANTFTFEVVTGRTTPATGTITAIGTGTTESYFPIVSSCNYNGAQVFQAETGGIIYTSASSATNDNGVYIDVRCRLNPMDMENLKRKSWPPIDLIADRVSGNALIRFSDDDYSSYTNYRTVSLSGHTSRLHRTGSSNRRIFMMRYTDSAVFQGYAFELVDQAKLGVK